MNKFKVGSLNWKELLAQFVTRCFGGERHWLPPHRRYIHQGLYLQSRREDFVKAVLAIDTSGSTVGEVLQHFTNELFALMKSFGRYELTVICCDAKIQSVNTVSPFDIFDISKIKIKGGGGTNFIPVFEYIEKHHPDNRNPDRKINNIYFYMKFTHLTQQNFCFLLNAVKKCDIIVIIILKMLNRR